MLLGAQLAELIAKDFKFLNALLNEEHNHGSAEVPLETIAKEMGTDKASIRGKIEKEHLDPLLVVEKKKGNTLVGLKPETVEILESLRSLSDTNYN